MSKTTLRYSLAIALPVVAALGHWAGAAHAEPEGNALFPTRVLYAPGHFGNSYEVMGEREMHGCLVEAKHWGFNGYADWMDRLMARRGEDDLAIQ